MYVTYNKSKEFQTPALNTNVIIASYVTTHVRMDLYSYLELLEDRALYCDTNSMIYRHLEGMYNSPIRESIGGLTQHLSTRAQAATKNTSTHRNKMG